MIRRCFNVTEILIDEPFQIRIILRRRSFSLCRYPTEQTSRSNLNTLVDSLALIKYYTGYLVIERLFLTFALVYEKNERGYIDS